MRLVSNIYLLTSLIKTKNIFNNNSLLKVPLAPLSLSTFSVPAFLVGIAALAGMEFAKKKMEKVK